MLDTNMSLFHLCLEVAQWLLIIALFFMLLRRRTNSRTLEMPAYEDNHRFESANSISFLGGFCVINKDGEDISSQFTPVLRKLLAVLVVHSVDGKQGVLRGKLDSLIWSYKPVGTAHNNRNVYLFRLRKALEGVEGVSISTKNLLTVISFAQQTSCDYVEINRLYKMDSSSVDVNRLLSLLSKGKPFVNMNDELLKECSDEFAAVTVSYLSQLLSREDLSSSMRQKISGIISHYDKSAI